MVNNILMLIMIGAVIFFFYYPIMGKPYPFKFNKKKKETKNKDVPKAPPIEGDFKDLIGIKQVLGNVVELKPENENRVFVGVLKAEPINYLLRSHAEQVQTDKSYETLLAQINLGPGRNAEITQHIQSRPIDLSVQLKPYEESFPELNPVAQRYASDMFFPFMESWQETVDDFDLQRYFIIPITYNPKLLEETDEESIILKVQNDFSRLGETISRNYGNMGGLTTFCEEYDFYEALYFALNKKTGSLEHFHKLMEKEGILSPFVNSNYSTDAIQVLNEVEEEGDQNEKDQIAI